ncbi:Formiminotransferase subdomain-containing protein [Ochromonadaceae sp. CCMP2298]|nr:Formiminotransferase subdomain-containing protein [Ochromonadaceae sp. CCMP2298]
MNRGCLCIVYVSEALNLQTIGQLTSAAGPALLHSFPDPTYNRTGFYLAGPNIVDTAAKFCDLAFSLVDFQAHTGTHPCLGSVDNVCFSPLGEEPMDLVVEAAQGLGRRLAQAGTPVYLYGDASTRALKDLRRQLGYFEGGKEGLSERVAEVPADFPAQGGYWATRGLSCVGAVPLILNFNMRFRPCDSRALVLQVTKHVRSHDVEALTLPHEGGAFEVACNLRQPVTGTSPELLLQRAGEKAAELGVQVESAYCTGPSEQELLDKLRQQLE